MMVGSNTGLAAKHTVLLKKHRLDSCSDDVDLVMAS
jgi:hypothetical protein